MTMTLPQSDDDEVAEATPGGRSGRASDLAQSTVSKHLACLLDCGIVGFAAIADFVTAAGRLRRPP